MANESGPDSRPISVSELLARRQGTTPPTTDQAPRGRRRAGRDGAVTMSELTGEIPRISDPRPEKATSSFPRSESPLASRAERRAAAERAEEQGATGSQSPAVEERSPAEPGPTASGMPHHSAPAETRGQAETPAPAEPTSVAEPILTTRDFSSGAVADRLDARAADPADDAVTGIIPRVQDESDREQWGHGDQSGREKRSEAGETAGSADFDSYRSFSDVPADDESDAPAKPKRSLLSRFAKKVPIDAGQAKKARRDAAVAAAGDSDTVIVEVSGQQIPATEDAAVEGTTADSHDSQPQGPASGTSVEPNAAFVASGDDAEQPGEDSEPVARLAYSEAPEHQPISQRPLSGEMPTDTAGGDMFEDEMFADDVSDTEGPAVQAPSGETSADEVAPTAQTKSEKPETHKRDQHGSSDPVEAADERSPLKAWLMLIGEVVVGVAVGVGVFWGFIELWKWAPWFALIMAVAVIFGIITFAHVVRKSRDLPTTLLALAVGLIVTLGPLVILV